MPKHYSFSSPEKSGVWGVSLLRLLWLVPEHLLRSLLDCRRYVFYQYYVLCEYTSITSHPWKAFSSAKGAALSGELFQCTARWLSFRSLPYLAIALKSIFPYFGLHVKLMHCGPSQSPRMGWEFRRRFFKCLRLACYIKIYFKVKRQICPREFTANLFNTRNNLIVIVSQKLNNFVEANLGIDKPSCYSQSTTAKRSVALD